jgi:hypothetical protein
MKRVVCMRKKQYQTVPLADVTNTQNPAEKETRFKQFQEKLHLKKG